MAVHKLAPTHPIRLGLALNYSVFLFEVQVRLEPCAGSQGWARGWRAGVWVRAAALGLAAQGVGVGSEPAAVG